MNRFSTEGDWSGYILNKVGEFYNWQSEIQNVFFVSRFEALDIYKVKVFYKFYDDKDINVIKSFNSILDLKELIEYIQRDSSYPHFSYTIYKLLKEDFEKKYIREQITNE